MIETCYFLIGFLVGSLVTAGLIQLAFKTASADKAKKRAHELSGENDW